MASSWRGASISPKAFGIPCGAYLRLMACLYVGHKPWVWITAVMIIVCFGVMAHIGWTLDVCWNKFLGFMRGGRIVSRPWWYRNRFRD